MMLAGIFVCMDDFAVIFVYMMSMDKFMQQL
jgi:hypothetical protein